MSTRSLQMIRIGGAVAIAALLTTAASCGGDDEKSTSGRRPSSTTTTETDSTPTTFDDPADAWAQDAQAYRGQDGTTYEQTCPGGGSAGPVWGAGVYTDDSSICTAAVQMGLITFKTGGDVTYEIGPAKDAFEGGEANGVTSQSYGAYGGSFTFPDAPPGSVEFAAGAESWNRNLADQRGKDGTKVTVVCSADGQAGSVWGSGPYTDDSSVCTAAVHAGLITLAEGGTVNVEVAAGESSYTGSAAHGVTSSDYGAFDGSFTFPSDQPAG